MIHTISSKLLLLLSSIIVQSSVSGSPTCRTPRAVTLMLKGARLKYHTNIMSLNNYKKAYSYVKCEDIFCRNVGYKYKMLKLACVNET